MLNLSRFACFSWGKFVLEDLLRVKDLTFRNSEAEYQTVLLNTTHAVLTGVLLLEPGLVSYKFH